MLRNSRDIRNSLRYFLMSRPIQPRSTVRPDKSNPGPLHLFLDIEEAKLPPPVSRPGLERVKDEEKEGENNGKG